MLPQFLRLEAFQVLDCGKGLLPCLTIKSVSCSENKEHEKGTVGQQKEREAPDLFIKGSHRGRHPSTLRAIGSSVTHTSHPAKIIDHSGEGLGAQKDPSPAKWSSLSYVGSWKLEGVHGSSGRSGW